MAVGERRVACSGGSWQDFGVNLAPTPPSILYIRTNTHKYPPTWLTTADSDSPPPTQLPFPCTLLTMSILARDVAAFKSTLQGVDTKSWHSAGPSSQTAPADQDHTGKKRKRPKSSMSCLHDFLVIKVH